MNTKSLKRSSFLRLSSVIVIVFLLLKLTLPVIAETVSNRFLSGEGAFSAKFDGIDIGKPDTDTEFKSTIVDAAQKNRNLSLITPFFGVGNKRIEITLAHGVGYVSLPGMVGSGNSWTWNPEKNPLPEQLQGRIISAVYTPAETTVNGHDFSNANYVPRAGKIVYTVSDGTTGIALDLPLSMDTAFANTQDGLTFNDAIKISVFDDGIQINNAVLDKYTVTGEVLMRPSFSSLRYNVSQGNTFNHYTYLSTYIKDQNLAMHNIHRLFEEYSVTFSVAKGVEFTGGVTLGTISSLKLTDIIDIKTDTTQANVNTLTLVIKTANMTFPDLNLEMKVDPTAVSGQSYTVTVKEQTVKTLFGQTTIGTMHSDTAVIMVASSDPDSDLTFELFSAATVHPDDWDSDAANLLLGGFRMSNYTIFDRANRKLTFDFSDPAIGVRALRLWVGAEGATDIVVVTTKGRTLNVGNKPAVKAGVNGHTSTVNMYNELASDEYIKKISYNMGTIISGDYTIVAMNNSTASSILYFGKLLGNAQPYKAVATLEKPNDSGGYVEVASYTQPISVTGTPNNNIVQYSFNTSHTNSPQNALTGGGAPKDISFGISLIGHRYSTTQVRVATGFTVYLRQLKDLSISNISASYGGKTYAAEGPFSDATGTPYYKIVFDDAILGYYNEKMDMYPEIKVKASFAANPSAPTFSVPLNEIVFVSQNDGYPANAGYSCSAPADNFGFNNGKALGSVLEVNQLMVTGQQAFNVATAASRDEVSWSQYNPVTKTGKISLNTKQDAFYQVSINNNSGNTITSGYTVMVPIPKADESFTSPYMNDKYTFNWPVSLAGEISSNIDSTKTSGVVYTVHYATTYAAMQDQDSVEWSSTLPSDLESIRAVKIFTTESLPDKFVDSFHFPLKLPKDSVAVQYSGEENIYPAIVNAVAGGSSGYTESQPVCLVLNTGIATGSALIDEDHDGIGEKPLAGVTVKAFAAGADIATATPIETVITKSDGSYQFVALSIEQDVDIVFNGWNASNYKVDSPSGAIFKNITPSSLGASNLNLTLIPPFEVNFQWAGKIPASPPIVKSQTIFKGDKATAPSDINVVGYSLDGWYTDSSATGVKFDFENTTIQNDITLYAKYTPIEYSISYVDPLNVTHGYVTSYTVEDSNITLPNLAAYGYTFKGWYSDAACKGPVSTIINTTAAPGNLVFHAKWGENGTSALADPDVYTISYNYGGGSMESGVTNPTSYTVLDLPITIKSPVLSGYSFTGWSGTAVGSGSFVLSVSPGGTVPNIINNEQSIFGDISLVGSWAINPYTLSFELNSSSTFPTNPTSIPNVQLDYGALISSAPGYVTPEREGWLFGGWYMDTAFSTAVGTETMPDSSTTIYAKWTQLSYQLSFDTQGEGDVATQQLYFKSLAQKPANPDKLGHKFEGWFDAESGGTKWGFDLDGMPSRSLTLFAQYSIASYQVTYKYSYIDQDDVIISVQFNELLQEPQVPKRDGHSFIGWADEDNVLWDFESTTLPAKDIILTTVWQINTYTVEFFDYDGNLLKAETVEWNKNATPPSNPERDGYTFIGWIGNFENVTKNEIVTADFVKNSETITTSSTDTILTSKTNNENGTIPKTGENGTLRVLIMLSGLVAFGVIITVFIARKHKAVKK